MFRSFTDAKRSVRTYLYYLVPQLRDLSGASFFSYKGSLTTPPCYQSVNWIVLKRPIPASEEVVRRFYSVNIDYHLFLEMKKV